MIEVDENTEGLTEEEAWQLLLSQEGEPHTQEEPEPVVVCLVCKETIVTNLVLDILNREVTETEALVDTGSALSFLGSETVRRCAPGLLKEIEEYPIRIHGITGEEVKVLGALTLPCQVAGKAVEHQLVVADIGEPALLGLYFMGGHQATWDTKKGDLVYQKGVDVTQRNLRRLVQAEELLSCSKWNSSQRRPGACPSL